LTLAADPPPFLRSSRDTSIEFEHLRRLEKLDVVDNGSH
jgi:hypothetical protein